MIVAFCCCCCCCSCVVICHVSLSSYQNLKKTHILTLDAQKLHGSLAAFPDQGKSIISICLDIDAIDISDDITKADTLETALLFLCGFGAEVSIADPKKKEREQARWKVNACTHTHTCTTHPHTHTHTHTTHKHTNTQTHSTTQTTQRTHKPKKNPPYQMLTFDTVVMITGPPVSRARRPHFSPSNSTVKVSRLSSFFG